MMDIFEKYKDYIIFSSLKQEFPNNYFRYENYYISIQTNKSEYLKYVFDARLLCQKCREEDIIGHLLVYFDEHLLAKRYDYQTYHDGEIVSKSHPMYIEGVTNSFLEFGDAEIHIYHYPHEIINIFHKKSFEFFSFVSSEDDILRELLYGVKKILSRYNYFKRIYSIHGAAVVKEGKAYLFLSGSRGGKSSLFINLISNQYHPINDDIVFWTKIKDKVKLFSCGTLPQIRRDTFKKVKPVKSIQGVDFSELRSAEEIMSKAIHEEDRDAILEAVFIPEIGYERSLITEVAKESVLKKELRACMVHGNYEADKDFLESFKILNAYPVYKLCMSDNYEEVCQTIDDFLKDYS